MNTKHIGEVSEVQVLARLMKKGEIVLTPYGDNQRYDLVLDRGGEFFRVQVKTGRIRAGAIRFPVCTTGTKARQRARQAYHGQADFFGVYCPDNDGVYLVPAADLPMGNEGCLRVEPPKNGQKAGVRLAERYAV